jgi:hypothetical protein
MATSGLVHLSWTIARSEAVSSAAYVLGAFALAAEAPRDDCAAQPSLRLVRCEGNRRTELARPSEHTFGDSSGRYWRRGIHLPQL